MTTNLCLSAPSSAGHGFAFGPIGPPSNAPFHNSNPFAHLKTEHVEEDDDEEGEITYRGRPHFRRPT